MTTIFCPLLQHSLKTPNHPFIISDQIISYKQFEGFVCYLQNKISHLPTQSVVATTTICPIFFSALLWACFRNQLLLFPVNTKLPPDQIQVILKEIHCSHYFDDPIDFSNHPLSSQEKEYSLSSPLTYILTSGSTSKPKICVHKASAHFNSAKSANEFLNYTYDDRWLLNLPLHHVGGISIIFRTILAGASLVLKKDSLNESIQSATHFSCVNAQLFDCINDPKTLKALKVILIGGGPINQMLYNRAKFLNLAVFKTYGLTECASQVATSKKGCDQLTPLSHCQLTLDCNQQILIKGSSLLEGYLKEGKIVSPLNSGGWFETGDLGQIENGCLKILGRLDNLFISGGENIQPEEIEAILTTYPQITEAIVVGKPDFKYGATPTAFIKADAGLDLKQLLVFLEGKLPKYKIPKTFLPLNYQGLKPARKELLNSLL